MLTQCEGGFRNQLGDGFEGQVLKTMDIRLWLQPLENALASTGLWLRLL